jgi:small basic protein
MDVLLSHLPGDPVANAAAIGVTLLAILDFLMGSVRALANQTFQLTSFSTWVRAHLLGHVIPIILLLSFGQVAGTINVGDFAFNTFVVAGLAAAAAYALPTAKSIIDSVNPQAPDTVPPKAV